MLFKTCEWKICCFSDCGAVIFILLFIQTITGGKIAKESKESENLWNKFSNLQIFDLDILKEGGKLKQKKMNRGEPENFTQFLNVCSETIPLTIKESIWLNNLLAKFELRPFRILFYISLEEYELLILDSNKYTPKNQDDILNIVETLADYDELFYYNQLSISVLKNKRS